MRSATTAILFFSRSAAAEAQTKSLHETFSARQREQLFQELISNTLAEVQKSGLPLIKSDDHTQVGHSFGERLANAIEDVFEQGYEQVIAIGNDCPNFSHRVLKTTKDQLATQKMVIGPATDGGAYLIGLHRETYTREKFINLRWESNRLFEDLLTYGSESSIPIYSLSCEMDIDTKKDLLLFLQKFRQHTKLRSIIWSLLHAVDRTLTSPLPTYSTSLYSVASLRGPPIR